MDTDKIVIGARGADPLSLLEAMQAELWNLPNRPEPWCCKPRGWATHVTGTSVRDAVERAWTMYQAQR